MSKLQTITLANCTIRPILVRDLASLARIQQDLPLLRWTHEDFRAVIQTPNTAGWVAEVEGRVVGYLIYVVGWQDDPAELDSLNLRRSDPHFAKRSQNRKPVHITLLNLAVASQWQRCGLGRALLKKLNLELRHADDYIQATVPESSLPVQLLLRDGGYRAVRILRGYYGQEDAYLMERQWS
jgi:ribosomal protein S18 acetylase RimI-like enzyme